MMYNYMICIVASSEHFNIILKKKEEKKSEIRTTHLVLIRSVSVNYNRLKNLSGRQIVSFFI